MKIAVVPNEKNVDALQAASVLQAWLCERGIDASVERSAGLSDEWEETSEALYATIDADGQAHEIVHDHARRVRTCDMVIALGGDGTTLHAARLVGFSGIPILSLNFGHLGFLSGGMADEMIEVVQTALSGEIVPSQRSALSVRLEYRDGSADSYFAFNEAMLAHGRLGTIIDLDVAVNGVPLMEVRGDGLIVCSATGSTAHALSAGGPIVAPGHRGPIIVPVAPHTLKTRPVVCDVADMVEVRPESGSDGARAISIDGKVLLSQGLVSMCVVRGPGDVMLYQTHRDTFYRSCAQTFFR